LDVWRRGERMGALEKWGESGEGGGVVRGSTTSAADVALEEMLRLQVVERGITDERVLGAMRSVPRERFFPPGTRDNVYADRAHPIGHGQTISQPYMVALMTARLEVRPTDRVLEIGTGSGYQTAILARLAAEVYSVERIKPLLDEAFERLMSLGYRNVHFRHGDGTLGWPGVLPTGGGTGEVTESPEFDRILIAAGAPVVPSQLLMGQLREGGIAVLPVGNDDRQMLVKVVRTGEKLATEEICPCRFVKLVGAEGHR
jgi:protein-L-isoaspartate(D-aspartate) O-methyltransferase